MQIASHGNSYGFSKVILGLEMILCMESSVYWVGGYFVDTLSSVNEEQEKKVFFHIAYGSSGCGWWLPRLRQAVSLVI